MRPALLNVTLVTTHTKAVGLICALPHRPPPAPKEPAPGLLAAIGALEMPELQAWRHHPLAEKPDVLVNRQVMPLYGGMNFTGARRNDSRPVLQARNLQILQSCQ